MTFLIDMPSLMARGLSRDAGDVRTVSVSFNRELTDDELRWLHDHLRHGIQHNYVGGVGCKYCDFDPYKEYVAPSICCAEDIGFGMKCRRERGHAGPHAQNPKVLFGEEPMPLPKSQRKETKSGEEVQ
jgi:hypothetical protein